MKVECPGSAWAIPFNDFQCVFIPLGDRYSVLRVLESEHELLATPWLFVVSIEAMENGSRCVIRQLYHFGASAGL